MNEWPTQETPVVETQKSKNRAEKVEALTGVNLFDEDVLSKLDEILGKPGCFNQNDLESLREYAKDGTHQPLEWSSLATNEKIFVENDGTFILGS